MLTKSSLPYSHVRVVGMETLVYLITGSLLMLVVVIMVGFFEMPPTHTQVLSVRVCHARLPIAH